MFPPMCAEFVPSPPTISNQIRIGLRKTPGNKNRGLELPSITEIQQLSSPTSDPGTQSTSMVKCHCGQVCARMWWRLCISVFAVSDALLAFVFNLSIFVCISSSSARIFREGLFLLSPIFLGHVGRLLGLLPDVLSGDLTFVLAITPADEQELVHVRDVDQARHPGEAPLQEQPEG